MVRQTMNEKDGFLGEASFGKEGSFVGSNPTPRATVSAFFELIRVQTHLGCCV
jgi:hypothetical protein